jgi:hypothetical protein
MAGLFHWAAFQLSSAREMAWPISLAAFRILAFIFSCQA